MPMSEYVQSIRDRVGTDLLLLPAVTAVIRDGEQFLLARDASGLWSLIGGGVEPGEEPADAVVREIFEETGAHVQIIGIVGAYGGPPLAVEYPNGDRATYITTAYECRLLSPATPDLDEIVELGWFDRDAIPASARREWIDRVLADVPRTEPTVAASHASEPGVHIAVADALSEDDFDALQRLLPQLSSTATFDRARIEAMLRHDGTDLVVAREDGALVGMATLASFPLPTGARGHLDDVVVDETLRGRGIARALLEAVIELARTRRLRTLDLTSRPSRESAIPLYEAVGFERRDSLLMRYAGDLG
ncbi:GNAT family N-acetyltransferase [Leifsonia shinshuensis]|uniref:GNAT family N-acetyltransferase n=1 Tax=Leifsonia shinshuensis TaxID=150026 RepID=UPI0028577F3B|nr:GNAT family N-acetyltransferase [Leifsonia shinshuensis]MDR6972259.1 ribosomal protein S18 acetylase RimI-like enzyme/8-oxo-dGTP pyrophosphatase MutT (NUDIX family) [Leifsonia shinshuensis]